MDLAEKTRLLLAREIPYLTMVSAVQAQGDGNEALMAVLENVGKQTDSVQALSDKIKDLEAKLKKLQEATPALETGGSGG